MTLRICVLLGTLGILPLSLATASVQTTPLESREDVTRSARRILHLARGTVFTAVARQHLGTWQFKRQGTWVDLPEGQVLRAPKESQVLDEHKRRSKALAPGVRAHLELARWCAAEGLRKEAIQRTDQILELHPHHEETLAFVGACKFIAIPSLDVDPELRTEALAKLLEFGSKGTRSCRERAIVELRKIEGQP